MRKILINVVVAIALFWWRLVYRLKKKYSEKPVGIPYERDPDNPCESYEPFKKMGNKGQMTGCHTDGHHLCKNCIHNMYLYPEIHREPQSGWEWELEEQFTPKEKQIV